MTAMRERRQPPKSFNVSPMAPRNPIHVYVAAMFDVVTDWGVKQEILNIVLV